MKIENFIHYIKYKKIVLLIILFFLVSIFIYYTIFHIQKNKLECAKQDVQKREKIYIFNKEEWCLEQKKYIKNNEHFYPISFKSKKDDNLDNDDYIIRNGYVSVQKNAEANLLLCHGFMTNKEDLSLLRCLLNNYNIITFDFRAHGENISSQFCTIGYDEKNDVIGAVKYIKSDPRLKDFPLFVYGFSMGAVASILAESENPNLFHGAIWDCPYESTNDLICQTLSKLAINCNGYSIRIPLKSVICKYMYNKNAQEYIKFFLHLFSFVDKSKVNTCIKKVSPIQALKKIKIPFFLIGCHNDDKAPARNIRNMYLSHSHDSFSRCWISRGRRHFDAVFLNPEKYIYKINKFITNVLSEDYLSKEKKKIDIEDNTFLINKVKV